MWNLFENFLVDMGIVSTDILIFQSSSRFPFRSCICFLISSSYDRALTVDLFVRSQWSNSNVPDCGVSGPRFESHHGQLQFYHKNHYTTIYSLGHGLHTLTAVLGSTQPSTLHGMVEWVSAFGLSNNNKWWWWVWLLAAYRQTHRPDRLAWYEGRQPLGTIRYSSYEPGDLLQWLWATMKAP